MEGDESSGPFQPSREAEILSLAAEGKTDKQIAADLAISLATVDTYWRRIKKRLDTVSRTEAVAKALNLRWGDVVNVYQAENERLMLEMQHHSLIERELKDRIENQRVIEERHAKDIQQLLEYVWRTRVLMASAGTVMWWVDASPPWMIEWISDSVSQWGYQVSELTDKAPIVDLVHEEDLMIFEASMLVATRNPMRAIEREYRVRTKDGNPRLVRERLASVIDPMRHAPRLVGVQVDIQPGEYSSTT
jgi:DNA-binding CsgD family transcriptional regulator